MTAESVHTHVYRGTVYLLYPDRSQEDTGVFSHWHTDDEPGHHHPGGPHQEPRLRDSIYHTYVGPAIERTPPAPADNMAKAVQILSKGALTIDRAAHQAYRIRYWREYLERYPDEDHPQWVRDIGAGEP